MNKNWCIHYAGTMGPGGVEKHECSAGVNYKSVQPTGMPIPCFIHERTPDNCALCPKFLLPTAEQLAERQVQIKASLERMGTARKAITDHLDGAKSGSGRIPCPCCESGTLGYSKSSYNGHIHAHCSTKGCVSWME